MTRTYILRTCNPDMTSHAGLVWPISGTVIAPDWNPEPECGNGLHGLLMGDGDGNLLNWGADVKWLVVAVDGQIINLDGKVKFQAGEVVFVGDRLSATNKIVELGADQTKVVGATVTGGDYATVTGGDRATVTGGYYATVTGGDRATVTGGDRATVTGGGSATVTGGDYATVTGGDGATLICKWWDGARYRIAVAYVGEDGIKANTPYRIECGKFVDAK